jgi:hypothetical protein
MNITDLIKLGKKALSMFDKYVADMGIEPPIRVYVRWFITNLELSETTRRSEASSEVIEKPDWSKTVYDFVEQNVKPLPEFEKLNQSIAKKYKKNINKITKGSNEVSQVASWLQTFIVRLLYEKLEGKITQDSLIEYASLFKSELEISPYELKYVYYLDGLFIKAKSIQINDNVLIRKTQAKDLEYTRDIFIEGSMTPYMNIPSSILEIEMYTRDETECHKYVNKLFNAFRLYRLGSVYSKILVSDKKTIIWPVSGGRSWSQTNYTAHRKYTITKQEVDMFTNFITTIEPQLDFGGDGREHRSLPVSMDRYNSALLESSNNDKRLMSAVMGLESLLTLEKDRGENAFKLGIRTAKLLSNLGFDALKVRESTEESYGFRNKIVHGSHISQANRNRMNEILPDILNYLRVSLTAFLLNKNVTKDKMVDMIDKATVSDAHNAKLKKAIESNTGEFQKVLS